MKVLAKHTSLWLGGFLAFAVIFLSPALAGAHCDTMDGPVVKAAQKALETGDLNLVLVWVQKDDEGAIREAFNKTLAVRRQSPQARELADMYFFETLVRIHRAGEGVAYTGVKPGGTVIDPGLLAADKAVEAGSADALIKQLTAAVQNGVRENFETLQARKNYDKKDVAAGREYVESYVVFIHYVEKLMQDAEKSAAPHAQEAEAAPAARHNH